VEDAERARGYSSITLSWPAPDTDFVLEATSEIESNVWIPVPQLPEILSNRWTLTQPLSASQRFYRLRRE
jgi:hypothetical protein